MANMHMYKGRGEGGGERDGGKQYRVRRNGRFPIDALSMILMKFSLRLLHTERTITTVMTQSYHDIICLTGQTDETS